MWSRFRSICIVGLGVNLLHPTPAAGQDLGRIDRIAEILGGRTSREIRQSTPRVQVRLAGTEVWVNAAPGSPVVRNQNILVQRYVNARLQVDETPLRGSLVLLPELLRATGERVFPAAAGQSSQEGVYGLGTQVERGDELTLSVDRGALLVDWVHGRLVVIAGGTRTVITGTRVAFSSEEDGATGYLFLEEGSVSFPDHPEVIAPVGELVRLSVGVPPAVVPLVPLQAQAVREAMRFNARQVWARGVPFWRNPVYVIPAAAAVVGGVIAAAAGGGEERPPEGTVIIRFPPR